MCTGSGIFENSGQVAFIRMKIHHTLYSTDVCLFILMFCLPNWEWSNKSKL